MTWNYRVLKTSTTRNFENKLTKWDTYEFHEAYYDDNGKIVSITKNPIPPSGETLEELSSTLEKYKEALSKPVIVEFKTPDGKIEYKDI